MKKESTIAKGEAFLIIRSGPAAVVLSSYNSLFGGGFGRGFPIGFDNAVLPHTTGARPPSTLIAVPVM
jgi:hypothetical protein